ncbi:Band 4.1-like protein 4A [Varanus komodoensis]|nr:Band 4.1-like protein 4A [Varanus komodoensis]
MSEYFTIFFSFQCNETSFFFEAQSKTACKHLWKCCVEQHTFFRMPENESNSLSRKLGKLGSLGYKHRFSGRTAFQMNRDLSVQLPRPDQTVERSRSKTYPKRASKPQQIGSHSTNQVNAHRETGENEGTTKIIAPSPMKRERMEKSALFANPVHHTTANSKHECGREDIYADRVCSLGVLLDPELLLDTQVTAVARSAFHQLQLIHQLCPYLEDNCLATVTHALVTSRLDFCNMLYVGLPLKTVRILQMVQNRAASFKKLRNESSPETQRSKTNAPWEENGPQSQAILGGFTCQALIYGELDWVYYSLAISVVNFEFSDSSLTLVDFTILPVTATNHQNFHIHVDITLQVGVKMNQDNHLEEDPDPVVIPAVGVNQKILIGNIGRRDIGDYEILQKIVACFSSSDNRLRQENDMVDSAPQWEAVLRRQKEKNQSESNHRRSRHRSRSRSPDVQAKEELWKHIQKELVDPSGLSEEQLREIPYTKIETQGDPVRIRHSHSPRSYRQYRRSQCSDGERSVLSEVNSKTDLVPPLPVTRSSDAQCPSIAVSQQRRNGSKDSLIEEKAQAAISTLDGKHSAKTIKIVQAPRLKIET